jgi:hypothetical protein
MHKEIPKQVSLTNAHLGQHRGFAVSLAAEALPEEEWNWVNKMSVIGGYNWAIAAVTGPDLATFNRPVPLQSIGRPPCTSKPLLRTKYGFMAGQKISPEYRAESADPRVRSPWNWVFNDAR